MKKAILSPLCSGLVIPGLGQIVNEQVKKGICILSAVFVLFIVGVIKLSQIIKALLQNMQMAGPDPAAVMAKLRAQDLSPLWYLLAAFALLWVYSVLDAYVGGRKKDLEEKGNQ